MDSVALLQQLSDAFGPPGFEDEVREAVRALAAPLADEVRADALGNLIAVRKGRSERTLMLDAHLDEVGFLVSHVEEEGFLRLAPLGGWDARVVPAHRIAIRTRQRGHVYGVVGSLPPHVLTPQERKRAHALEDLFVDVGARDADEVRASGVRVGDPAVVHYPFEHVNEDTCVGKAFDDRAGCAAALRVLDALQGHELPWTLAVSFSAREEVGLRGARTAAYQLRPELALALEGTIAADVPGVAAAKQTTQLGKGAAISVADRSLVVPREVVILLEELAQAEGIAYQHKTPVFGGTDAGAIQESRAGVRCGVVSVPCRYIHAPLSLLRLGDFEGAWRLARAFALQAPERLA